MFVHVCVLIGDIRNIHWCTCFLVFGYCLDILDLENRTDHFMPCHGAHGLAGSVTCSCSVASDQDSEARLSTWKNRNWWEWLGPVNGLVEIPLLLNVFFLFACIFMNAIYCLHFQSCFFALVFVIIHVLELFPVSSSIPILLITSAQKDRETLAEMSCSSLCKISLTSSHTGRSNWVTSRFNSYLSLTCGR